MVIRYVYPQTFLWEVIFKIILISCVLLFVLSTSMNCSQDTQTNATTKKVGNATTRIIKQKNIQTNRKNSKRVNGTKPQAKVEKEVKWKDPVIVPAIENHTRTIIFLHGSGETGDTWASTLTNIRPSETKLICPTAKEFKSKFSNSTGKSTCWLTRTGGKEISQNLEDMNKSTSFIHNLIDKEIECGIDPQKIILGGFAQGGAVAIQSAVSYPKRLGAIMVMSSYLPLAKDFWTYYKPTQKNISIFQGHGEKDESVPWEIGSFTATEFRRFTKNLQFRSYPNVSHEVSINGTNDMMEFLKNQTLITP